MSKIENKWENLTQWEKQKAYEGLSSLIRISAQKRRVNKTSVEDRIKEIRRKFLGGKIIE